MNTKIMLRRIGPLSLARIAGLIYGLMGLIIGGIVSIASLLGAAFSSGSGFSSPFGGLFGVAAVIFLPIVYAIMGFLGGLITAGLYNLLVGVAGPIELDIEQTSAAGQTL